MILPSLAVKGEIGAMDSLHQSVWRRGVLRTGGRGACIFLLALLLLSSQSLVVANTTIIEADFDLSQHAARSHTSSAPTVAVIGTHFIPSGLALVF